MQLYIFVFSLLLVLPSHALTLKIIDESGKELFHTQIDTTLPISLGQLSVSVFDKVAIPYEGGSYGMKKIFHLDNEIQIISDDEMKAYGWCFSINGTTPETMADQTIINEQEAEIVWYYGYAHYKKGEWIGQCLTNIK